MSRFIDYIEESKVFKEFFINLPTPLNNVYFLILIAGIVLIMLLSSVFDAIFAHIRHKQILKKAEESKSASNEQVNENMLGFLAAMQYAFMAKQKPKDDIVTIEEQPANYIEQKESYFEATMREQRQKDKRKRQLFEQREAARLKAEAVKSQLSKEEELFNEG